MNLYAKIISQNAKLAAYLSGFLAFIVLVFILIALKQILIPFTIAVFLTFLFHPLLKYFSDYKIPKGITLIFIAGALIVISYFLALILVPNMDSLGEKLQVYSAKLTQILQQVLRPLNISLTDFEEMTGVNPENSQSGNLLKRLFASGAADNIFSFGVSVMFDFFISIIFWVIMILGKDKFEERLKIAFSEKDDLVSSSISNIDEQLQSYIFIKTFISMLTGLGTTIILLLFGIDSAVLWGLLAFILNYIPNIGSLIATAIPVLISILEYGFGLKTISLVILLLAIQNLLGNILEPHYLGRQMDLSPVFILFSLVFWGLVWGIIGMFLAVPIAVVIKILFDNIQPLKPIGFLLGTKTGAQGL
ncbi:MAG: AI-2E family transporter [Ignavibacteriaceae bacterium]